MREFVDWKSRLQQLCIIFAENRNTVCRSSRVYLLYTKLEFVRGASTLDVVSVSFREYIIIKVYIVFIPCAVRDGRRAKKSVRATAAAMLFGSKSAALSNKRVYFSRRVSTWSRVMMIRTQAQQAANLTHTQAAVCYTCAIITHELLTCFEFYIAGIHVCMDLDMWCRLVWGGVVGNTCMSTYIMDICMIIARRHCSPYYYSTCIHWIGMVVAELEGERISWRHTTGL